MQFHGLVSITVSLLLSKYRLLGGDGVTTTKTIENQTNNWTQLVLMVRFSYRHSCKKKRHNSRFCHILKFVWFWLKRAKWQLKMASTAVNVPRHRRVWTLILGQNGRRSVDYLQHKSTRTFQIHIIFKLTITCNDLKSKQVRMVWIFSGKSALTKVNWVKSDAFERKFWVKMGAV